MLFNSIEFLIYLPIVFLLYWFVFKPLRAQNLFVVVASYVFYGWWDWRFLLLMGFTTLCSYWSGLLLEHYEGRRGTQKWVSAGNITLNLLILCVFGGIVWLLLPEKPYDLADEETKTFQSKQADF